MAEEADEVLDVFQPRSRDSTFSFSSTNPFATETNDSAPTSDVFSFDFGSLDVFTQNEEDEDEVFSETNGENGDPGVDFHVSDHHGTEIQPNYIVSYRYEAKLEDEVDLKVGDELFVKEKGEDGWFVGINLTTGSSGTFPGNFVTAIDNTLSKDEELARKLQQEEDAKFHSSEATVTEDEKIARLLQEEEDMLLARAVQTTKPVSKPRQLASVPHAEFPLGFLGSIRVTEIKNRSVVVGAIRQVLSARKAQRVKSIPRYTLRVTQQTIVLIEDRQLRKSRRRKEETGPLKVLSYPLQNIALCAFDTNNPRYFGFISRDPSSRQCACHVFRTDKTSEPIARAISHAFKMAVAESSTAQTRS